MSQFQPMRMSSQSNDTLGNIDKGLLKCGNFASIIQIVCSVLFIIIFGGIGVYMYQKKDNRLETQATVTNVNCRQEVVNSGGRRGGTRIETKCIMDVKYNVDGKEYTGIVDTSETIHKTNDIITIKYDSTNPNVISYKQLSNRTIGMILMAIGSFIILLLSLHIVLLQVSDWYKRLLCIQMVGSAVSSAFSPVSSFGNY
jgi:hypothetical protein